MESRVSLPVRVELSTRSPDAIKGGIGESRETLIARTKNSRVVDEEVRVVLLIDQLGNLPIHRTPLP